MYNDAIEMRLLARCYFPGDKKSNSVGQFAQCLEQFCVASGIQRDHFIGKHFWVNCNTDVFLTNRSDWTVVSFWFLNPKTNFVLLKDIG